MRKSVNARLSDDFFKKTEESGDRKEEIQKESYKLQSYYLTQELIDALNFQAVFEKKNKSVLVREAIEHYLDERYIKMAREEKAKNEEEKREHYHQNK